MFTRLSLSVLVLSFVTLLHACNKPPKRPDITRNAQNALPGDPANPSAGIPVFVDSNDPLDSYLSIGPYLQKEFDSVDGSGKTVKVFLQIRQENSVEKNIESLKHILGSVHVSASPALDSALKKKASTVEFEADVAKLKNEISKINLAVSGIEVSLPALK